MSGRYTLFDPETRVRLRITADYAAGICRIWVNDDPEVRTMMFTDHISLWSLAKTALSKCIAEAWHITGQRLYDESKAGLL